MPRMVAMVINVLKCVGRFMEGFRVQSVGVNILIHSQIQVLDRSI